MLKMSVVLFPDYHGGSNASDVVPTFILWLTFTIGSSVNLVFQNI